MNFISKNFHSEHIPALDGLRGLAALCVVYSHTQQFGLLDTPIRFTGALGVTVFFALSGFLMAFLYSRTPLNMKTAGAYAVSRFARIAPIYLLVIIFAWTIRGFVDHDFIYNINNHNIIRHLLFSGSESVFWSIPPEVQFYAFFVGLWWACHKARSGIYYPSLILALASVAMVALPSFVHLPGTTLPTKMTFFLFGSVAGLLSSHVRERITMKAGIVFAAQIAILCAAAVYLISMRGQDDEAPFRSLGYSLLCAALIFVFSLPSKYADRSFGSKCCRALGRWSFAIYLIHDACIYVGRKLVLAGYLPTWGGLALAVFLTVFLSFVLHECVERPAQRRLKALAATRPVDSLAPQAVA